ncbi:hypothetical protein [Acetobacter tropicalis]|uniref:hypothetical protein n=1 Tax=Acetobacter tropicalis TaxID=104102 RepID=UPI001F492BC5|nr:hypothetical protein [Acetobacter tropicalis]
MSVLCRGSQCHVIDIAAGRVVAQVENNERLAGFLVNRDGPMLGFPCYPVGTLHLSIEPDLAVAVIGFCPSECLAGTWQAVGCWGFFQFVFQSVDD